LLYGDFNLASDDIKASNKKARRSSKQKQEKVMRLTRYESEFIRAGDSCLERVIRHKNGKR
jgi:hypothetical protein